MSDVWISVIVVLYGSFAEAIYHLAWRGFIYICICRKLEFPSSVETLHQNPLLDHLFLDRSCDSLKMFITRPIPKSLQLMLSGTAQILTPFRLQRITCHLLSWMLDSARRLYLSLSEDCLWLPRTWSYLWSWIGRFSKSFPTCDTVSASSGNYSYKNAQSLCRLQEVFQRLWGSSASFLAISSDPVEIGDCISLKIFVLLLTLKMGDVSGTI